MTTARRIIPPGAPICPAMILIMRNRSIGEDYVKVTVILAAVLFPLVTGRRFPIRGARLAVTGVAGAFLIYCIVLLVRYPHA